MPQEATKTPRVPRRTSLKPDTLSATIYAEVRARLQRGEVDPNDRLLDYELATEFDCTRMPVRQALMRLVSEGYLEGTTRGFIVPELSAQDVREIFEVRRLLEPPAAAQVAATISLQQQATMLRAFDKVCKAHEEKDILAMIQANTEFRNVWFLEVQNVRLKSTIERFADHVQHVRVRTLTDQGTQAIVIEGLRKLLKGFLDRDAEVVRVTLDEFMRAAEQQYFALSRDNT